MKITTLIKVSLPIALLALAGGNAFAATCGSSMTMLTVSQSGFSCTLGDLTFSNFYYNYTAGIDTGAPVDLGSAPTPNPNTDVTVNFTEITNGGSDTYGTAGTVSNPLYTVVVDYANNNTVAEYQNEHYFVSYLVTDNAAGTNINQVDAAVGGTGSDNGSTASLTVKNICAGGVFTPNGGEPENNCSQGSRNVYQAVASSGLALVGNPDTEADSSINYQAVNQNDGWFDGGNSPGSTTFGIYDQADTDGGTTSTSGLASITSVENDFLEQIPTGTPEPGTFVLIGGALVALGAMRRRKAA